MWLSLLCFLAFLFVGINYKLNKRKIKGIPNIGFIELLRNKKKFPLLTVKIANETKSKFIGAELLVFRGLMATHPDSVKFVLKNEDLFPKARGVRPGKVARLITRNVLTANGDEWKTHRAVMNPSFQFEAIKHCTEVFIENGKEILKYWDNERREGPVDVANWMTRYTIDSLGKALFDIEFNSIKGGDQSFAEAYFYVFAYMGNPLMRLTTYLPFLESTKKLERSCDIIFEMIEKIKKAKLTPRSGITKFNTVDLAYQLFQDDNGLDDENKIADTIILFIAGHETTATALTWTMWLLAKHPEVQEKLRSEIQQVFPDGSEPTHEGLKKLSYLSKVLKESLRIYPPVTFVQSRIVAEDTEFEGIKIPKGTRIGIGTAALHRRDDIWTNPDTFDPEREFPSTWSYAPFSLGSRNCLGLNFAQVEMQVFLVMMLQKYRLEYAKHEPEPRGNFIVWQVDKLLLNAVPL